MLKISKKHDGVFEIRIDGSEDLPGDLHNLRGCMDRIKAMQTLLQNRDAIAKEKWPEIIRLYSEAVQSLETYAAIIEEIYETART